MSGIEAEFHLLVENVKKRELPELNDEFAASNGEFSRLDELQSAIKTSLESQAVEEYNATYDEEILKESSVQPDFVFRSIADVESLLIKNKDFS